jgi:hypothetical protein
MKLAGDPNNPASFKDDAGADQLREEIIRTYACSLMAVFLMWRQC